MKDLAKSAIGKLMSQPQNAQTKRQKILKTIRTSQDKKKLPTCNKSKSNLTIAKSMDKGL